MLVATSSTKFYAEHLGMKKFGEGASGELSIMTRSGQGSVFKD